MDDRRRVRLGVWPIAAARKSSCTRPELASPSSFSLPQPTRVLCQPRCARSPLRPSTPPAPGIPFVIASTDRMRSPLSVLSLLVLLAHHAYALRFDVNIRQRAASVLAARANGQNTTPITNTRNSEYIANVTLGGRQIPVLLDTGRYVSSHSGLFQAIDVFGVL